MFSIINFVLSSIWTLFVRSIHWLLILFMGIFAGIASVLYTVELAPYALVAGLAFSVFCNLIHMMYEFIMLLVEVRAYENARLYGSNFTLVRTAKNLSIRVECVMDGYLTAEFRRTMKAQKDDLMQVIRNNQ
ncbi:MAG: hypothetical protein ACOVQN_05455 [Exiguobacterium sp.]|jgi:hypothetical protein